jgi:hypothetical protein
LSSLVSEITPGATTTLSIDTTNAKPSSTSVNFASPRDVFGGLMGSCDCVCGSNALVFGNLERRGVLCTKGGMIRVHNSTRKRNEIGLCGDGPP